MKIADLIRIAVDRADGASAARVCEFLAERYNMTAREVFKMVRSVRPGISFPEWDDLVREGERTEFS